MADNGILRIPVCIAMCNCILSLMQLYIGATLNLVGAALRLISSVEGLTCSTVPKAAFYVALFGQALTAVAQPFSLYAPTTLAAVWFGPKERALATNFASVGKSLRRSASVIPSRYYYFALQPTLLALL